MNVPSDIRPANDVKRPQILYGTAWKKVRTEHFVVEAIRAVFRGIDTACQPKHYDEAGVGRGVARCLGKELSRDDLYLQTKFTPLGGHDPARVPYDREAPIDEQVRQSFEVSLENLRTGYVDGLVLHSPLADAAQTFEAWRALEAIVGQGGARRLGISNCYSLKLLEALYREAAVKPALLQNRFYRETGFDVEIRAFCRANGIDYQSFWTLTANPDLLEDTATRAIAARHGRTPAQVLFRYLTQQDVVPLTGTTSAEHMREDLAIFEFALTAEEQEEVTALLR